MSFQSSQEQIHHAVSQTDEEMQSILSSIAFEETCMANEIYASAEMLRTALKLEYSDSTNNPAWIESLNGLDSSTEDVISGIIQKEIASIGKIQKILGQSLHSEYDEKLKEADTAQVQ